MRDPKDSLRHRSAVSSPSISRTPSYASHLDPSPPPTSSSHVALIIGEQQQQQQSQQSTQHQHIIGNNSIHYSSDIDDLETGGTETINNDKHNKTSTTSGSSFSIFSSPTRKPLHLGPTLPLTDPNTNSNNTGGGGGGGLFGGVLRRRSSPVKQSSFTKSSKTLVESDSPRTDKKNMHHHHQQQLYQPAVAVPDSMYRHYYYNHQQQRKQDSACSLRSCCHGCMYFSIVGMSFLLFVGILVDQQPLYLQGVRPKQCGGSGNNNNNSNANNKACANTAINYVTSGARLPIASTAYKTAIAYFITILICIMFLYDPLNIIQTRIRRRQYHDIPDAATANAPRSGGSSHTNISIHMGDAASSSGTAAYEYEPNLMYEVSSRVAPIINRIRRWRYAASGGGANNYNKAKKR
mmetsp:Transcript_19046/g.26881  ORF Transcript_19046/g.26881 Transcript_19046/m.26881 type:complete len:407 (+) Transcript_19046:78-1298(+)